MKWFFCLITEETRISYRRLGIISYEAEAARLAIAAGKIETEEWSHEKSKIASRILTKVRLSIGSKFPCDA